MKQIDRIHNMNEQELLNIEKLTDEQLLLEIKQVKEQIKELYELYESIKDNA